MKHLVFAEKPSVARDIARVLGARQRANGYFEGEHWIVTWGVGHLISLAEPGEQNPAWTKWNLQTLPMLPEVWKLKVLEQTASQFAIVKALMSRADVADIVNAADAGREGELIFRYVYEAATAAKPIRRLWISSMTDEAIKQGFQNLKPGTEFDNLGQAARCRSIADWLIGMNGTRGYTKRFNTMLTVGRVQTPTLAMVVRRQQEIEAFKPEPYWEISVQLDDFQAQWFDPENPEKESAARLLDRSKAESIRAMLMGARAVVTRTRSETKKIPPPLLYDLTTLQREANRFFGLTAAQTLQIVQVLYEQRKVVTYPRTDSQHLSDDLHPTISDRLKGLPAEYQPFTQELSRQPIPKNKRVFDNAKVSDHHAIIPTEKSAHDIRSWKPDEQKVYDLIARRFLAAFFPNWDYQATSVELEAAGQSLRASGRVTLKKGWKSVFDRNTADTEEKEEDQSLPPLKKDDQRQVQEVTILDKKTKPPAAYTEATLLRDMETAGKFVEDEELRQAMKESGLGTPATRAEIIEKLIRVGYLTRDKKRLVPTEKGKELVRLIDQRLKSPELTGAWENRLSLIAKGKHDPAQFAADIRQLVTEIVQTIRESRFEDVKRESLGQDQGRRPGNESTSQPTAPPKSTDRSNTAKAATDKPAPPAASSKAAQGNTASTRQIVGTCPRCREGHIVKGNTAYGCLRYREGCQFRLPFEYLGKSLSEAMLKQLLNGKETRATVGFSAPDGTRLSGKLRLNQDTWEIELIPVAQADKPRTRKKKEVETP